MAQAYKAELASFPNATPRQFLYKPTSSAQKLKIPIATKPMTIVDLLLTSGFQLIKQNKPIMIAIASIDFMANRRHESSR